MPSQKYVHPANPGALGFDKQIYIRLREQKQDRRLVDKFEIPPISGHAWPVPKAHLCRIVSVEGPQAGDFNVWNLNNPRERFWCARSRQINGCHVTTHSRLWSSLPYLRPMLTFTDDTVPLSENGVRCHDLIGTRCDPYIFKIVEGRDVDYTCHTLLTRAVAPYHLTELDVHDVVNLFSTRALRSRRRDPHHGFRPGAARRLHRVLRRDRPALRPGRLSQRRLHDGKQPDRGRRPTPVWRRRRFLRHLQAPGRRGIRRGRGAAGGLDASRACEAGVRVRRVVAANLTKVAVSGADKAAHKRLTTDVVPVEWGRRADKAYAKQQPAAPVARGAAGAVANGPPYPPTCAVAAISTRNAGFTRPVCTQARAGGLLGKYSPYTVFIFW